MMFVALFYLLLLAWTIVCVSLMGLRANQWSWAVHLIDDGVYPGIYLVFCDCHIV
jgi:hypothetical protein